MKIMMRDQSDKEWKLVETAAYGNEAQLQHLLTESPSLISIADVRENAAPLALAIHEFALPIGFIDILAFSPTGDIAAIECKLASNPEAKRKVIGQVLEYGANLWHMSYEDLDQGVQLRTGLPLGEAMRKAIPEAEWDEESFRSNVEAALANGNFILIIVVDEINEELSRIVRYMNVCGNQGFDFAALEMRRYQNESAKIEMLIPRFFGPAHTAKPPSGSNISKRWDEPSFFAELQARHGDDAVKSARRLLAWGKQNTTRIWWGKGKQWGSFVPCLDHNGKSHQLFAVYTYGTMEIYFQWYSVKPPFDQEEKCLEILNRLNKIEGVAIPTEAINRRPSIPLDVLAADDKMDLFLVIYDWFIKEIKAS